MELLCSHSATAQLCLLPLSQSRDPIVRAKNKIKEARRSCPGCAVRRPHPLQLLQKFCRNVNASYVTNIIDCRFAEASFKTSSSASGCLVKLLSPLNRIISSNSLLQATTQSFFAPAFYSKPKGTTDHLVLLLPENLTAQVAAWHST